MANFPTSPKPNYPVDVVREHRTLIYGAENGAEQRQKKWGDKYRRHFFLTYDNQTALTIWNFLADYYGMAETFTLNPYNLQSDLDNESITVRLNDDSVKKTYTKSKLHSISFELIEVF